MTVMLAISAPTSDPLTADDLLRLRYGGGRRELVDGCLVITREVGYYVREDLADLPEDGRKHELLDGQVVVSPGPRPIHQRAVLRLATALDAVLPPGLEALPAPVDLVIPGPLPSLLLPDVLVVPAVTPATVDVERPLLAAEVLSPSTRRFDVGRKRAAYARAGIAVYLLVDPLEPALTVLALRDGAYEEVGSVQGDATVTLPRPLGLVLSAAQLVAPRWTEPLGGAGAPARSE